jgi:uncharacterized protein (DUF1501 family)
MSMHTPNNLNPNRRSVLAGVGAVAGIAALRAIAPETRGHASVPAGSDVPLIVVFLRGGADALSWVAPVTDSYYIQRRPTTHILAPTSPSDPRWLDYGRRLALPEAAYVGLDPAINLKVPFDNGDLTFLVGAGLQCPASGGCGNTKSHFEMMNYLESGSSPGGTINQFGWIGRYLNNLTASTAFKGISHGPLLPRSLAGSTGVVPAEDVQNFPFPGTSSMEQPLINLNVANTQPSPAYQQSAQSLVSSQQALEGVSWFDNPEFPDTDFGQALRKTADMLLHGLPLKTIHINYGGWDHHNDMGPRIPVVLPADPAQFYYMARDVSHSLGAFYNTMGGDSGAKNYRLIVVSEFGRRAFENGSLGTDHGTGGVAILMGGGIRDGSYAQTVLFPNFTLPTGSPGAGLRAPNVLVGTGTDDEDLITNLDLRDVIGELLVRSGTLTVPEVFGSLPNAVFSGRAQPASWLNLIG